MLAFGVFVRPGLVDELDDALDSGCRARRFPAQQCPHPTAHYVQRAYERQPSQRQLRTCARLAELDLVSAGRNQAPTTACLQIPIRPLPLAHT